MNIFRELINLLYPEADNEHDESKGSGVSKWVGIALMVVLIILTVAYFLYPDS